MRHLAVLLVSLSVLGCNMYGAKPQKLKAPSTIKPPKDLPKDDVVVKPTMVLECEYRWSATQPTKKIPTERVTAAERNGDDSVRTFGTSTTKEAKTTAISGGIEAYARALVDDPFNPVITLKLALAYDKVNRQGCAIAMLARLAKLSDHPKYSKDTNVTIDEVVNKKEYFRWYRNEAVRAVGR